MKTTRPVIIDPSPGKIHEFIAECGPCIGRLERPARVLTHAPPFALNPDKAEISPGRADSVIPFVNEPHFKPVPTKTVGKGRA